MLDLRQIRTDPEPARAGLRRRGVDPAVLDEALELDERRRAILPELEELQTPQERGQQAHRRAAARRRGRLGGDRRRCAPTRRARRSSTRSCAASRSGARRRWRRCRTCPSESAPPADETLREVGEAGRAGRDHVELLGDLVDLEAGARVAGSRFVYLKGPLVRLELALVHVGARPARGRGLHAGRAAGARARGGAVRHRHAARHRAADLPRARGRPLSRRHLRGAARLAARRADPRRAAAALRRLLALLPARGGRRRQGHAGHVPRAPVRQGRDVRVRRPGRARATSTSGCWRSRRRSCRRSASRTGW